MSATWRNILHTRASQSQAPSKDTCGIVSAVDEDGVEDDDCANEKKEKKKRKKEKPSQQPATNTKYTPTSPSHRIIQIAEVERRVVPVILDV
jgi:hypothetical protein